MAGTELEITGLVLAGGRARRMGEQDKGLLRFRGQPMAQQIATLLSVQCSDVLINANRNLADYEEFGFPVIADTFTGFQGPLAGMLAGLQTTSSDWIITTPCDGPWLAVDYVCRMQQAITANKHDLAVAACDGRLQPVYALISNQLTESLKLFLQSDERKIDKWFLQHPHSIVDFSDTPEMFENINTMEQLRQLERN